MDAPPGFLLPPQLVSSGDSANELRKSIIRCQMEAEKLANSALPKAVKDLRALASAQAVVIKDVFVYLENIEWRVAGYEPPSMDGSGHGHHSNNGSSFGAPHYFVTNPNAHVAAIVNSFCRNVVDAGPLSDDEIDDYTPPTYRNNGHHSDEGQTKRVATRPRPGISHLPPPSEDDRLRPLPPPRQVSRVAEPFPPPTTRSDMMRTPSDGDGMPVAPDRKSVV